MDVSSNLCHHPLWTFYSKFVLNNFCPFQSAAGIIFPIIKAEGVRQMFFPATVPAYYRAPTAKPDI
jgi:hypothetical protein